MPGMHDMTRVENVPLMPGMHDMHDSPMDAKRPGIAFAHAAH